jgi:hypothetical protein
MLVREFVRASARSGALTSSLPAGGPPAGLALNSLARRLIKSPFPTRLGCAAAVPGLLSGRNGRPQISVLGFRTAANADETTIGEEKRIMKPTTILAIALGLGSLAACNKSPEQNAADNYEANADNAADQMEANVDNAADQMTANAENASDAMKAAADNKSDAMKNAADNTADAMANKSH